MNYVTVYFSPTGTAEKNSVSITEALAEGEKIGRVDLTSHSMRETEKVFSADDFVVFGAPVYGGRIPEVAAQRFARMHGQQTPCIVTVTYGNRDYDDALLELMDIVQTNGFVVQAAAALIGQHTFGQVQVGRPNEDDLKENRQFAQIFLEEEKKYTGKNNVNLSIKGNHPYKEGGKGGKFRPLTSDSCIQCELCVENCPTGAIDSDCSTIDTERCISCFRCIRICPVQAKNMLDSNYMAFAEVVSKKLAARKENEYFLPKG